MNTQCDKLLDYLQNHISITPKDAWNKLGIYRLSARVFDLRRLGYDIATNRKEVLDPFGEPKYVAEYRLRA